MEERYYRVTNVDTYLDEGCSYTIDGVFMHPYLRRSEVILHEITRKEYEIWRWRVAMRMFKIAKTKSERAKHFNYATAIYRHIVWLGQ